MHRRQPSFLTSFRLAFLEVTQQQHSLMPSMSCITRLVALLLAISSAFGTELVGGEKPNLRRRTEGALICLILEVHVRMVSGEEDHLECELISADDGAIVHGLQIKLPEALVEDNAKAIRRGEWFVMIHGAKVEETVIEGFGSLRTCVWVPEHAKIVTLSPEEGDLYVEAIKGSRVSRYMSEDRSLTESRRIMVVRVSTSDSAPTYTAAQLQQYYFSLSSYSLVRQYALCSASTLWFKGFRGSQPSVLDVYVPGIAASFGKETLWQAALVIVQNQLGLSSVTSVTEHVAFVLPSGLQGGQWFGIGTVGGVPGRSIFSDTYGGIPNTIMHEIGHNLGLGHAGLGGDQYADETDIMGYGAYQQFGPSKCFNGVHLWDLGWYPDKSITVNPFTHYILQLGSFADYPKLLPGHYVNINVGNFYIVYNKATGVNSGTGAVPDMVTISAPGVYTQRVAAISDTTPPFEIGNYLGSIGTLYVRVCSFISWNGTKLALLSIGVNNINCS